MIRVGQQAELHWLRYRKLKIDTQFYRRLVLEISAAADSERFVLISGGMGTHLYSNFARDLGLGAEAVDECARSQIHTLHEVIKTFVTDQGLDVHQQQVPISQLGNVLDSSSSKVIFIHPSDAHCSTDDLAADAARCASAKRLILFKARVPYYTVGFETETEVVSWPLRDMAKRAADFELERRGSYIVSSSALKLIASCSYDVELRSPAAVSLLGTQNSHSDCTVVTR